MNHTTSSKSLFIEHQPDGQTFVIELTPSGDWTGYIDRHDGTQYAHVNRRYASHVRVYLMVNFKALEPFSPGELMGMDGAFLDEQPVEAVS
jgi:hypothetical protein